MSVYVYCPRKSQGALELVHALNASRLRKFDGLRFWDKKRRFEPKQGDTVICWGALFPDELEGVKILNGSTGPTSKYQELRKLRNYVPCVNAYAITDFNRGDLPTRAQGYLWRKNDHVGGYDLLTIPAVPDYIVSKEKFLNEYRIHSFDGRSIRAGQKIIREGFTEIKSESEWRPNARMAHPWIRSFDAGWRVNYDGFKSNSNMRNLAHQAVKVLGLTFGAVDIAQTSDGSYKVLEVNRAPGIEGNTIGAYARAINRWMQGEAKDTDGSEE